MWGEVFDLTSWFLDCDSLVGRGCGSQPVRCVFMGDQRFFGRVFGDRICVCVSKIRKCGGVECGVAHLNGMVFVLGVYPSLDLRLVCVC